MNVNLLAVANLFNCEVSDIEGKLNELFPAMQSGRKITEDLLKEITLGECKLKRIDDEIVRIVNVVNIEIPNPLDPSQFLWEVRQEYPDQTVERNNQWISEKILGDEPPEVAAIRSLKEELGIIIHNSQVEYLENELLDNPQSAYQGIKSKSMVYRFRATIKQEDYLPEYREVQQNKTTVFQWK